MPRKLARLCDLPRGRSAVIRAVDDSVAELMDLGFVAGAEVRPTHAGLGGDPRVYEVDGAQVALRRSTARHVQVALAEELP